MPSAVCNLIYESGKRGVEFTEDALEKFVELIVRECVGVAQNKDDTDINLRLARGLAAFKILEHFGVEP
jgi:hypothetical protein